MRLMKIYSDKYAAKLNDDGQGEYLDDLNSPAGLPPNAPPGAPAGFVRLPMTGHILPVATDKQFSDYLTRDDVAKAAGADRPATYNLYMSSGDLPASEWPRLADRWYNQKAYQTAEEAAKEAENSKRDHDAGGGTWPGQKP